MFVYTPSEHLKILLDIPQYEQRSPEWFEQRKDKLTSSDAATALGINPYQTPEELLFKKCGHGKPFEGNMATLHGQKYEDEAIDKYCQVMGKKNYNFGLIDFDAVDRPNDLYSKDNYPNGIPWMAGSTDGIAEDLDNEEHLVVLEVKCPFRRKIVFGECPEYYYPQVQLNMYILNIDKADFIEYKPATKTEPMILNIVRIHKNIQWLDENIPILEKFWKSVVEWRKKDIRTHPEYYKYHKKILSMDNDSVVVDVRPAKKMMFLNDSDSDSDSDSEMEC